MQKHHGIIVKGVNEDAKNEEVFGGIDGWGAVCRGAAGDAGEPAADVHYGERRDCGRTELPAHQ